MAIVLRVLAGLDREPSEDAVLAAVEQAQAASVAMSPESGAMCGVSFDVDPARFEEALRQALSRKE